MIFFGYFDMILKKKGFSVSVQKMSTLNDFTTLNPKKRPNPTKPIHSKEDMFSIKLNVNQHVPPKEGRKKKT